ncbi:MAG: YggT family protein [Candidatus Omnitrophica bacterium]|nr:YggT family protein [Candidatus Omnitrophota bacterium]
MFIFAEFFKALALLFNLLFNVLYFLLIIRIILSWVNPDPYNEIVQIIYRVTDPILAPFRQLPLQMGGIDFSPIVAFLLLSVLKNFIVNVLYGIAFRLGG